MKILAVIPARYQSSRFPGKPLADINGKTMIERVYAQVQKASNIDKIIVATDDARILSAVEAFGGNVALTSANHHSGTERCGEIITTENSFDVVINIQGDEPFIHPQQIDVLTNLFINDEKTEIASLMKTANKREEINNPNRVKVVTDKNNHALYFSRLPIPYKGNTFNLHVGMYGYQANVLKKIVGLKPSKLEKAESLEQLRWLENGYQIKMQITEKETIGIDTPEDLIQALGKL